MLEVPQLDFATLNYVAPLYTQASVVGTSLWDWSGPSQSVQHIALAVMGLGQILPIPSPASNATWTLDFWGPALQCNDVAKTERDRTWVNIWNSYNGSNTGPYVFLSWVPWSYLDDSLDGLPDRRPDGSPLQFSPPDGDINLPFLFSVTSDLPVIGPPASFLTTNGSASFFIAIFPEALNFTLIYERADEPTLIRHQVFADSWNSCDFQMIHEITDPGTARCSNNKGQGTAAPQTTAAQIYANSTLLRCDLLNTSYSVDFIYSGVTQDIHVSSDMTGNSTIMNSTGIFVGPQSSLTGSLTSDPETPLPPPANCSSFMPFDRLDAIELCVFDLDGIRQLSYQGIMAAFNRLVLGSIQTQDNTIDTNTSVVSTILATAEEFAFLRNWSPSDQNAGGNSGRLTGDLQSVISNSTGWAYPGLVNLNPINTNADLKSTLERLFQNFTISLLAEPYLQ